jgi:capsular polysaccharide biosynthesis protein
MQNIRETPLKERFEAASAAFATTFSRKARLHRAGERFYSASEFLEDLLKAARENELFPEALWAYFGALHTSHQIDCGRKRFGGYGPLRPRGTGSMGTMRTKVLRWGVVASLLVALCVVALSMYQIPKYEATAVLLVGFEEQRNDTPGIHPLPNPGSGPGLQTFKLTVAKAIPTKPVARAVVERLNLPNGSAGKVISNMSVESDPGSALIHVTYEDSDPKKAQLVANAIGRVVSQKLSEVRLGSNRINTKIWKPAKLPSTAVSPKPLRNGIITLVVGLALVLAWAFVRGALRNSRGI